LCIFTIVTGRLSGRRLLLPLGIASLTFAGAFLVFTALGVGGGQSSSADGANARHGAPHPISAIQAYSEADARRNGVAGEGGAPPAPELVPIPAAAFDGPIAQYRAYSEGQLTAMLAAVAELQRALEANRLAAARAAWEAAFADYLHLGAVYGEFGELNRAIDGAPGGLSGGAHDPRFTGLHRLELGLWQSAAPPSRLLGVAARLAADVRLLRARLPSEQITPLEYATRVHEIMEDAIRDLLSGVDVPWSHDGVLATAAGVYATHELLATLGPLLDGREDAIEIVDSALLRLDGVLATLHRAHHGRWPTLEQLSQDEAELLDGAVGATAEALDQVPGALETKLPPPIPPIPGAPR
jgi:iron uptake system EfeUOB component EfeO/EfeM